MTKKKVEPQPKLTFGQNVKEYWPLMIFGILVVGLVLYALVSFLMPQTGRRIVWTGDVVSTTAEQSIFDNLTLDGTYDTPVNAGVLEDYRVGNSYAFDLGSYNNHVLRGHRYAVAMRYDGDLQVLLVEPEGKR